VQKRLEAEGLGRVLLKSDHIPSPAGDVKGVFISDSAKPNGHIATQFEEMVEKYIKAANSLLNWGNMAADRQPALAGTLSKVLEAKEKELAAKVQTFKALNAGPTNGSTSTP
jgi:hypothetical protein